MWAMLSEDRILERSGVPWGAFRMQANQPASKAQKRQFAIREDTFLYCRVQKVFAGGGHHRTKQSGSREQVGCPPSTPKPLQRLRQQLT